MEISLEGKVALVTGETRTATVTAANRDPFGADGGACASPETSSPTAAAAAAACAAAAPLLLWQLSRDAYETVLRGSSSHHDHHGRHHHGCHVGQRLGALPAMGCHKQCPNQLR